MSTTEETCPANPDRPASQRRLIIADGTRTYRLEDGNLLLEQGTLAHHVHDPAAALILQTLALGGGDGGLGVLEDLALEVARRDVKSSTTAGSVVARDQLNAARAQVAQSTAGLVVAGVLEVSAPHTAHVAMIDLADASRTARDVAALLRQGGARVQGPDDGPDGGPTPDGERPGLIVVVCDDVLRVDTARRTTELLDSGAVVLPVVVGAGEVCVGPLLAPGPCTTTSRCLTCLQTSLARNLPEVLQDARAGSHGALHPAAPGPLLAALGVAVTATLTLEAVRALQADDSREADGPLQPGAGDGWTQLRVWGAGSVAPALHPVVSMCPPLEALAPPRRQPGQLRALSARTLLARTAHLISERTGVLAPPRVIHEGPTGVVVSTTCAVSAGTSPRGPRWQRVVAHGGGGTIEQASAAAVGEALERCAAGWSEHLAATADHRCGPRARIVRASAEDLGVAALLPHDLLAFSDDQRASGAPGVPAAMPSDAVTDWVRLTEWGGSADRWVPAAAVHFGHPDLSVARWCLPDSNGCATGADLPEAVLAGLLELVERDAVARWWYPAAQVPAVALEVLASLDALSRARIEAVQAELLAAGGELQLLDVTSDLGIPVVVAVGIGAARGRAGGSRTGGSRTGGDDILLGFGAHLDRASAAARAVGELAMLRALVVAGVAGVPAGWEEARFADLPFLQAVPQAVSQAGRQVAPLPGDVEGIVDLVVQRVRAAGTTVLVQDLGHPCPALAAARVVAPGLRPWYRRLAPGRLSPGKHGWNPWPLPV
ncbi:YcaO-like family protein [Kineococcus arenarius]|uniref:YcaO-like family protein n=1 Tax=unclassified Kineococcus TaxID=2621656 RepID=UPI003D7C977E